MRTKLPFIDGGEFNNAATNLTAATSPNKTSNCQQYSSIFNTRLDHMTIARVLDAGAGGKTYHLDSNLLEFARHCVKIRASV